MGEVAGAGLLAHVPTIMLPYSERLELNEGKEISLVPGLERLRAEVFDALDYDTVVVLDSHWHTTVEFVVSAQATRAGLFTSDELPRGMSRIPYDWPGDPELAHAIAGQAGKQCAQLDRCACVGWKSSSPTLNSPRTTPPVPQATHCPDHRP